MGLRHWSQKKSEGASVLPFKQCNIIFPIFFIPEHPHFLGHDRIDRLAYIIGLDREFPTEAAVDQHAELHPGRPSESKKCIKGSADGASFIQYIIDQHYALSFYRKRYISLV